MNAEQYAFQYDPLPHEKAENIPTKVSDLDEGDYLPEYGKTVARTRWGGSQQRIIVFKEGGESNALDPDQEVEVGKKPAANDA